MIYTGRIKNGMVVLDEDVQLPEGIEVRVEPVETAGGQPMDENGQTLGQKLMKYAGKAVGLPDDAARNHDHYLYGSPKK